MAGPSTIPDFEDRLGQWLEAKIPGARGVSISGLASPEAGASNETLLFTASWSEAGRACSRDLVARLRPGAEGIFPRYDLALQFRAMAALADTAVPVPVVLALEEDDSVLGRPFYIMEQVHGRYLADNPPYHMAGWLTECSAQERRLIWCNAIREVARINKVDWAGCGFGEICDYAPYATPLHQLIARYEQFLEWAETRSRPYPKLRACLAWLRQHQPGDQPLALCWGDAKVSNLMIRGTDICATLDWEMVHLGNPVHDLAWWFVLDGSLSEGLGIAPLEGVPDRQELIALWQQESGFSAADLDYYEFLSVFQFAVIMARVGTLLTASGLFRPEDEFDLNNNCTPLVDHWMARHRITASTGER